MSISLGTVHLNIGAKMEGLQKSLGTIKNKIGPQLAQTARRTGTAFTAMGAAITGVLSLTVISTAKAGDEIQKMALRTGFSTEALSTWKHALELNDATLKDLQGGVRGMAMTLDDANDGLATGVDALAKLGLTVVDFQGLSPEETFEKLFYAVGSVEDPIKRLAAANDIFRRSGMALLPAIAAGSEVIREQRQEAVTLGKVFSQDASDAAALFMDNLARLTAAIAGVKFVTGMELIPTLNILIPKITQAVVAFRQWVTDNRDTFASITKIVAVVGALAIVLGPILVVLPGIATAFKLVLVAIGALGGPVTALIAGVIATIAAFGGWKNALYAIGFPIWLIIGAVQTLIGWLKNAWFWIKKVFGFGGGATGMTAPALHPVMPLISPRTPASATAATAGTAASGGWGGGSPLSGPVLNMNIQQFTGTEGNVNNLARTLMGELQGRLINRGMSPAITG